MDGGSAFFASIKRHIEEVALPQLRAYQLLPLQEPWKHCTLCGFPTKATCDENGCGKPLCRQPWCAKPLKCGKCGGAYCGSIYEKDLKCGMCSQDGCSAFCCARCEGSDCRFECQALDFLCAKHAISNGMKTRIDPATGRMHYICMLCAPLEAERAARAVPTQGIQCGFCPDFTPANMPMCGQCCVCQAVLTACVLHVGDYIACRECKH